MYEMCYVVDKVPNAATTSTNHFPCVRLEALRSCSSYEGLRGGEETGEERKSREGSDLGVCFDGSFTKNGETKIASVSSLDWGELMGKCSAHKPTMSS